MMDYEVIFSNIPLYFEGLWVTIQLVFLALVLGFVLHCRLHYGGLPGTSGFDFFPKPISIFSGAPRSWCRCL
ncbi:MAG: hypothetical protein CM1200mP30_33650 [Pseudomonadota bacterium]|nr:MAG: hypothetical protein CM1200mP30_33650 [Pseudomonadota bacterium]